MKHIKAVIFFVIIVAVVYVFRFSPFAQEITIESIRQFLLSFGFFTWILFILIYAIGAVISIPGTILTFVGAILFGAWLGTLLNVIGATIGATLAFLVARYLAHDYIDGLFKYENIKQKLNEHGFKIIFILRLLPFVPYFALNYVAGLSRIRLKDFILASFLGMIPGTFIYTYLFATVGEQILTEGFSLQAILVPEVFIAIGLFILLMTSTIFIKKYYGKKVLK